MRVLIIGAGLGGLACAIACRKEGFEVVVLERASKIVPVSQTTLLPLYIEMQLADGSALADRCGHSSPAKWDQSGPAVRLSGQDAQMRGRD